MKTSDSQIELIKALLAAQQEFPKIEKSKDGQAGNRKFKYAPHEVILDAVGPVLRKHGLLLTHGPAGHQLVTRLDHASGEWRECQMPVNDQHANLQSYGIELTYLRRYSAQLLLGIITEDDTDGDGPKKRSNGVDNAEPRNENGTRQAPRIGALSSSADAAAKSIADDRRLELARQADDMNVLFRTGAGIKASKGYSELSDNDEKLYLWARLDSKLRTFIRAQGPMQ